MSDFAPAYCERGKVITIGDGLIRCHVCGHSLKTLGRHTLYAHGLTANEYRREFWITGGLVSPDLKKRLAKIHGPRLSEMNPLVEVTNRCVQCSKEFTAPVEKRGSSNRTKKHKATCSEECRVARMQLLRNDMMARGDVRAKLSTAGKSRSVARQRNGNGQWTIDGK